MRTAVITGSTRGIGRGLARELAAAGVNVVVSGRDPDHVAATVSQLGASTPERVHGVACDVTDAAQVQTLWDGAVARFGRVDIWVNNAGATTTPLVLWDVADDEVTRTIRTNLLGTLYGCKVASAGMKAQSSGGFIYNIEGMGSKGEVQVGVTTYATSKAGVGYLFDALRKDLKGTGVKIGAIRPGINVTSHLLYGAEVLTPERWAKTKKIFNILGDKPETTTPWLAAQILANTKDGRRIRWLTPAKIAWRFTTAGMRTRDLFADIELPHAGAIGRAANKESDR